MSRLRVGMINTSDDRERSLYNRYSFTASVCISFLYMTTTTSIYQPATAPNEAGAIAPMKSKPALTGRRTAVKAV